jgi:hypothetical protein
MATPASLAVAQVLSLLTADPGLNGNLDTLAQIQDTPLPPLALSQISTSNIAFDVQERSGGVTYPALYIYCDKLSNSLTEKFRTFSGTAGVVVEVRLSQDQVDGLAATLESYVDAVTQVLDQNRGDWGQGLFYAGGYDVAFGPVKHGGRNFIQIAKITFEVGASTN